MVTTDAERSRLFDAAKSRAEVDQLHLRFQQEDEAAERERRFPMTARSPGPAVDEALIAGIADVIAQRDKRLAALERQVQAMRQELDAVERIKSVGAEVDRKMSERSSELAQISRQLAELTELVEPRPSARRSATAKLRQ